MKEKEVKKHHLEELLSHLRLSETEFANSIEENPTKINHVLNFRNGISSKLARAITSKYKDVNFEWLRTGKEPMLKSGIYESKVKGNNNISVAGNENQVNSDVLLELHKGYQEMIRVNQAQLTESQTQISRLISVIEQLNNK